MQIQRYCAVSTNIFCRFSVIFNHQAPFSGGAPLRGECLQSQGSFVTICLELRNLFSHKNSAIIGCEVLRLTQNSIKPVIMLTIFYWTQNRDMVCKVQVQEKKNVILTRTTTIMITETRTARNFSKNLICDHLILRRVLGWRDERWSRSRASKWRLESCQRIPEPISYPLCFLTPG